MFFLVCLVEVDSSVGSAKLGIRNASVVAAVLAAGIDTLLFVRKPKTSSVQVRPSGVGLSLQVSLY